MKVNSTRFIFEIGGFTLLDIWLIRIEYGTNDPSEWLHGIIFLNMTLWDNG